MAEPIEVTQLQAEKSAPQPGWIDRWITWIDNLSMSAGMFYLLAVLALTLVIHLTLWIDGAVPFGAYAAIPGIFPPVVFAFMALYHYLTHVGIQSLHNFRPLLDVSEAEFAEIEYRFSVLPRKTDWLLLVISIPLAAPFLIDNPSTWGDLTPNTAWALLVFFVIIIFFNYTFIALNIRSFRQIKMISELHARASNLNLMKLEPVHAFSALTSRTGIGLFLISLFGVLYNPSAAVSTTWTIIGYIIIACMAIAVFIVPLIGIRGLLGQKKTSELHKMEDLIQSTNEQLHQKVTRGEYDDLGGIQSALNMLTRERDQIKGVPTWPWNPGTLRGFASTLILPVFLRYVYQLVENLF